jgi:hypothetical protein
VLGVIWFWHASMSAREHANGAAREACERLRLVMLDGTVSIMRLWLRPIPMRQACASNGPTVSTTPTTGTGASGLHCDAWARVTSVGLAAARRAELAGSGIRSGALNKRTRANWRPHFRLGVSLATKMNDNKVDTYIFSNMTRLKELRIAHRDLDDVITRLVENPLVDQLQLKRLKKRKLALKDQIAGSKASSFPISTPERRGLARRAEKQSAETGGSDARTDRKASCEIAAAAQFYLL